MFIMICNKQIIVPVLPMPALQWTIAFYSGGEFIIKFINYIRVFSKSFIEGPEGSPWSGHPI